MLEGRTVGIYEKFKDKLAVSTFVDVGVTSSGVLLSVTQDGSLVQVYALKYCVPNLY